MRSVATAGGRGLKLGHEIWPKASTMSPPVRERGLKLRAWGLHMPSIMKKPSIKDSTNYEEFIIIG